jgi:tRNA pseudouridine38-40 synthase
MPRYFLEISYKGTAYSGFQSQLNTSKTIQAEVEKAFYTLEREQVQLTSSSRTDAGVHALQNYFHFDANPLLHSWRRAGDEAWRRAGDEAGRGAGGEGQFLYKMNAILPADIVVKKLIEVPAEAHCRFDAVSRDYRYYIYRRKDPFLQDRAFYFPYRLDIEKMQEAAAILKEYSDFTSFSKRNTQVKTFECRILDSGWHWEEGCLVYQVRANRFLRGMVRALTATMLKIGREKLTIAGFRQIIEARDCTQASFAVPAHGLFLISVKFPYISDVEAV